MPQIVSDEHIFNCIHDGLFSETFFNCGNMLNIEDTVYPSFQAFLDAISKHRGFKVCRHNFYVPNIALYENLRKKSS